MVIKLSELNSSREEFTNPKVGFITSTANLSITTTFQGFGTFEIDKYYSVCLGGDDNIYFGSSNGTTTEAGYIVKFEPKTNSITKFNIEGEIPGIGALVCGKDGNIYTIPGIGGTVFKFDIINETIENFITVGSGSTSEFFKYKTACLSTNGNIYALPYESSSILKINPTTETATTFGFFFPSPSGWESCVLGPDGNIYGIPYVSTVVLKIDTTNDTTTTFSSVGNGGWIGGCLAPNGKIYCPPYNGFMTQSVLKIDPITQTTTTFGSIDLSNFTYANGPYYGWIGGSLAPNGKIYCSPVGGKGILEINPENDTVSVIGIGSLPPQELPSPFGGDNWYRWAPFVMAPDGKLYAPPQNESKILVFGETSTKKPADWLLSPYCNKGP